MLNLRGLASNRERGQGVIEYGLIVAGIAILAIATVALLGPKIQAVISRVQLS